MFVPSKKILQNYADVLVRFALGSGKGVKPGEVIYLVTPHVALPLARAVYAAALQAGAHPLLQIVDDAARLIHFQNASEDQLTFFPKKYYKGLADSIDHWVRILGDEDPFYLKKILPEKLMLANKSTSQFRKWLDIKEDKGDFTWTLCLYGTEAMAKEANLTEKQYWNQIINACFLREKSPIQTWQSVYAEMDKIMRKLNHMPIDKLHIDAPGTDLWISLGEQRKWLGGQGRNIPSFEIFTSPDWRGTQGYITFDLPLYRYGNIITDIRLEFENGKVSKAVARKNQRLLHELIAQKNADKIGEYSLTDVRFSKINKFMANTLFDENFGGKFGNTHLAVGRAYHDTFSGDHKKATPAYLKRLGFNDSVEHTDIIASTNRTVTAHLHSGETKVIYYEGQFQL